MSMINTRQVVLVTAAAVTCLQSIDRQQCRASKPTINASVKQEIQVTDQSIGHILTNTNVWSPDGRWIVYDTRSDPAGEKFDGNTIEIVDVETGTVRETYRSRNGAHCGAATFSPTANKVAFILG